MLLPASNQSIRRPPASRSGQFRIGRQAAYPRQRPAPYWSTCAPGRYSALLLRNKGWPGCRSAFVNIWGREDYSLAVAFTTSLSLL